MDSKLIDDLVAAAGDAAVAKEYATAVRYVAETSIKLGFARGKLEKAIERTEQELRDAQQVIRSFQKKIYGLREFVNDLNDKIDNLETELEECK